MSGHSKWHSIKHKKGAIDAKRGRLFTKIIRELVIAARMGGSDVSNNPRLRVAIASAKDANMPKDTIERNIKKGAGEIEGTTYEDVAYEGYGPGGVAILVESSTDNRNRTASQIRHIFTKHNGNLGAAYVFMRDGVTYDELGADYFDRRHRDRTVRRHVRQLEALGFHVTIEKAA